MNPDPTAIARAINHLAAVQQKGPWDYIGTVAVVLTLLVLIWYTFETYKLRTAAQRQNETALMPVLAVAVVRRDGPMGTYLSSLIMRNAKGAGAAFNLSIDAYRTEGFELVFQCLNTLLGPDEEQDLSFHLEQGQSGTKGNVDTLYKWINTGPLPDPLAVVVRCRSVSGTDYAFTFHLTPSEGRLKAVFERAEVVARR